MRVVDQFKVEKGGSDFNIRQVLGRGGRKVKSTVRKMSSGHKTSASTNTMHPALRRKDKEV